MSEPSPGLQKFFDAFASMLELRRDVGWVERELGPSPSGKHRMGFYGVLARRNRFLALSDMCPAFREAALALKPPMWAELVNRYAELHPPSHADPNRFAENFGEFVAAERARGLPLPIYLEELADYEFALWAVGIAEFKPTLDDPGLERTILVRQYTHDLASFVADVHAGVAPEAPAIRPIVVLIYQHTRTGFPRTFLPTAAGIAALGRRAGRRLPNAAFDDETLSLAERELVEYGVLVG